MKFYYNNISGDTAYMGSTLVSNFKIGTTESVTDYDGNVYTIIRVGKQKWFQQNLRVTHLNDGTLITNLTGVTTPNSIFYSWYNNSYQTGITYGALYSGYAALDSNIAPTGCHVPTIEEVSELFDYKLNAGALKETGFTYWNSPNSGATNSTYFTALPGGLRWHDGDFYYINIDCNLWTASLSTSSDLCYWGATYSTNVMNRGQFYKNEGLSIRCLKDQVLNKPTVSISISDITQSTVDVTMTIASTTSVTRRGACFTYGTDRTTPTTTLNNVSLSGTGDGTFTFTVTLDATGLIHPRTYDIRGFAQNSDGLGYSNTITFTTLS
jgi:uncharacterized protein (TIGR02145 family)